MITTCRLAHSTLWWRGLWWWLRLLTLLRLSGAEPATGWLAIFRESQYHWGPVRKEERLKQKHNAAHLTSTHKNSIQSLQYQMLGICVDVNLQRINLLLLKMRSHQSVLLGTDIHCPLNPSEGQNPSDLYPFSLQLQTCGQVAGSLPDQAWCNEAGAGCSLLWYF